MCSSPSNIAEHTTRLGLYHLYEFVEAVSSTVIRNLLLFAFFYIGAGITISRSQTVRAPVGVAVVADIPPTKHRTFKTYCRGGSDTCVTTPMNYDFADAPLAAPFSVDWSTNQPRLLFLADTIEHVQATARIDWRTTQGGTLCFTCAAVYYTDVPLDCISYYDDSVHTTGFGGWALGFFATNPDQTSYVDTVLISTIGVYNNTLDTIEIESYSIKMDSAVDVRAFLEDDSSTHSAFRILPHSYFKPVVHLRSNLPPFSEQRDFHGVFTTRLVGPNTDSVASLSVTIRFYPSTAEVHESSVQELSMSCERLAVPGELEFVVTSPVDEHASIELFDLLGRKVRTLYEGPVGIRETRFRAAVTKGLFFARMETGTGVISTKVVVAD